MADEFGGGLCQCFAVVCQHGCLCVQDFGFFCEPFLLLCDAFAAGLCFAAALNQAGGVVLRFLGLADEGVEILLGLGGLGFGLGEGFGGGLCLGLGLGEFGCGGGDFCGECVAAGFEADGVGGGVCAEEGGAVAADAVSFGGEPDLVGLQGVLAGEGVV